MQATLAQSDFKSITTETREINFYENYTKPSGSKNWRRKLTPMQYEVYAERMAPKPPHGTNIGITKEEGLYVDIVSGEAARRVQKEEIDSS
jgi:hypothetical protein